MSAKKQAQYSQVLVLLLPGLLQQLEWLELQQFLTLQAALCFPQWE